MKRSLEWRLFRGEGCRTTTLKREKNSWVQGGGTSSHLGYFSCLLHQAYPLPFPPPPPLATNPRPSGGGGAPRRSGRRARGELVGRRGAPSPGHCWWRMGARYLLRWGKSDFATGREAATRPRHEPQGAPVDWLGFVHWHWVRLGQTMHLRRRGGAGIVRVHMRLHGACGG